MFSVAQRYLPGELLGRVRMVRGGRVEKRRGGRGRRARDVEEESDGESA